jgi:hypothetical protein
LSYFPLALEEDLGMTDGVEQGPEIQANIPDVRENELLSDITDLLLGAIVGGGDLLIEPLSADSGRTDFDASLWNHVLQDLSGIDVVQGDIPNEDSSGCISIGDELSFTSCIDGIDNDCDEVVDWIEEWGCSVCANSCHSS